MTEPIIPWIGGKRRLAATILPLFPPHTCYCEPFAGGAALLLMKEPSKSEILNDLNGELVNLYRVCKHHLVALLETFRWAMTSRRIFEWCKATPPETLTDIHRAARFYYLQRNAFGGRVKGQSFGTSTTAAPRLNLMRLEEDLSALHMRLANVTIENLEWQDCIDRYDRPHTLFYMDPPYWQTEGYGVPFPLEQYHALAAAMRTMKGKAILSINDHPDMREAFAGFARQRLELRYSVGGAKRAKKPAGELVIRSFNGR